MEYRSFSITGNISIDSAGIFEAKSGRFECLGRSGRGKPRQRRQKTGRGGRQRVKQGNVPASAHYRRGQSNRRRRPAANATDVVPRLSSWVPVAQQLALQQLGVQKPFSSQASRSTPSSSPKLPQQPGGNWRLRSQTVSGLGCPCVRKRL
jgi:hypothetical protein